MKSRGIFSCLCHSLDAMEDEMRSLCGFLGRFCAGKKRQERCRPCQKSPCDAPDFCDFRCEECEKRDSKC